MDCLRLEPVYILWVSCQQSLELYSYWYRSLVIDKMNTLELFL